MYTNYNTLLRKQFGNRVQKVSINAGFTCPNRDGSKGYGGCTYCNNQSFVPGYSRTTKSITQQIDEGVVFFQKKEKYKDQVYLAYFQSYTNTYEGLDKLKSMYEEALAHPRVQGIVIGTRPDCVDDALLDYLAELHQKHYVMLEYGIESTSDKTLQFINRGHDYQCSVHAIEATAKRRIPVGAHLILGLPGETREQILQHAIRINQLPLTAIKLHQLQLVKGTIMAKQAIENPAIFQFFTVDEYIELVIDFIELLSPNIAIERFVSQSPKELLISPDWGLKNFEFTAQLEKRMKERGAAQGKLFK